MTLLVVVAAPRLRLSAACSIVVFATISMFFSLSEALASEEDFQEDGAKLLAGDDSGRRFMRRESVAVTDGGAVIGDRDYAGKPPHKRTQDYVVGERADFFSSSRNQWFPGRIWEVKDGSIKVVFTALNGSQAMKEFAADDSNLRAPKVDASELWQHPAAVAAERQRLAAVEEVDAHGWMAKAASGEFQAVGPGGKPEAALLHDVLSHSHGGGLIDREDAALMKSAGHALQELAGARHGSAASAGLASIHAAVAETLQHAAREDATGAAKKDGTPQVQAPDMAKNFVEAIVHIGPSIQNERCVISPYAVSCPSNAGDRDVRLNAETSDEAYSVTVSGGKTVCVKRVDRSDGWQMNLKLGCNRQAVVTVDMGLSDAATKCLTIFPAVSCTWNAANNGIRSGDSTDSEEGSFYVESLAVGASTSQSRVCATRLDGSNWDFGLTFLCNVQDQAFEYDARTLDFPRSPSRNDKCFTWEKATDIYKCPTNAAEWNLAMTSRRAEMEVSSAYAFTGDMIGGTRVCARRVDSAEGWQAEFQLTCMQRGTIMVGPSLTSNQKCITVDEPISCVSKAADLGFRYNNDPDEATFDVTASGFTVCVRRKDRVEGWSMNLMVGCTPQVGIEADSASDAGISITKSSSRRRRESFLETIEDPTEANIVSDGMVVWLEHQKLGFYACNDATDCSAGRHAAADRFRLFADSAESGAPLMNGNTVYMRHERTLMWMQCDKLCSSSSACPTSSNNVTDFSKCTRERFTIYNAAGSGAIRDGDIVYLLHSNNRFLLCDEAGDTCMVNGLCPAGPAQRQVMRDSCTGERFKLYAGYAGQKDKQAVAISIGPSFNQLKCVEMSGDTVTCAKNAGDSGLRWKHSENGNEDPKFEITVRGDVGSPTNYQVCARRTDAESGWSVNLNITCSRRAMAPMWPHDVPAAVLRLAPAAPPDTTGVESAYGLSTAGKAKKAQSSPKLDVPKTEPGEFTKVLADAQKAMPDQIAVKIHKATQEAVSKAAADAAAEAASKYGNSAAATEAAARAAQEAMSASASAAAAAAITALTSEAAAAAAASASDAVKKAAETAAANAANGVVTGAPRKVAPSSSSCWEPTTGCKSPFQVKGKYYMGCMRDAAGGEALCATEAQPDVSRKDHWQECRQVACSEVCFEPAPACVDPFLYEDFFYAGCIRENGQAWCSHTNKWTKDAYAGGEWSWCKQVSCSATCWQPSSSCVLPFKWNEQTYSGCVLPSEGEKALGKGAWCSTVGDLAGGARDWAYCKQVSCNQVMGPPGSQQLVNAQPVMNPGSRFSLAGTGISCTGGQELYAGKGSLAECAAMCEKNIACKSYSVAVGSACSQCTLSTSGCETNAASDCDGKVMTYAKMGVTYDGAGYKGLQEKVTFLDFNATHSMHRSSMVHEAQQLHKRVTVHRRKQSSRQQPQVKTCGGTSHGAVCMFPFTFNDVEYDNCTTADSTEPWCMTDESGHWGNCNCPDEATQAAQEEADRRFSPYSSNNESVVGASADDSGGADATGTEAQPSTANSGLWSQTGENPAQGGAGKDACPCVGLAAKGTLETGIKVAGSSSFVKYPIEVGSGCKAWDQSYHPDCKHEDVAKRPAWCPQAWCFVDPCNCNLTDAYRRSTIFPGATYQGKALAYSYTTCDAPDLLANASEDSDKSVGSGIDGSRTKNDYINCRDEANAANDVGMYNCKCVGLANITGVLSVAQGEGNPRAELVADTGSSCAVWDMSNHQLCTGDVAKQPEWCGNNLEKPWCFVDPCACGLAIAPEPAVMAPEIRIGNRPLYYSMATCQPADAALWNDAEHATSCLQYGDKALCEESPIGNCVWDAASGNCLDTLRQNCPQQALTAMLPSLTAVQKEQAKCPLQLCPVGMSLKSRAASGEIRCASAPCSNFDISTCCAPSATCKTFGDCGETAIERNGSHLCSGVVCSFEADFDTCCEARALCTSFPSDKCPVGYTGLEDPTNRTCSGKSCELAVDFVRCCREDKSTMIWILVTMTLVAVVVGGYISWWLISAYRNDAVQRQAKQREELDTREDPDDGQKYTLSQFKEKYRQQGVTDEVIEVKWQGCKQVTNPVDAAIRLQSQQRGKQARLETAKFLETRRAPDGEIYSFSEWRAKYPELDLEELKEQFASFPADKKSGEEDLPPR
eukprot:TRINITY_DN121243_c0_g1_i1.p1 TRINITY_DN121243_c0_g1~~TRINITY_DN121243_c0_g1_i1.p1  ORF type:complete len:2145 (-),score=544.07 TRINITY_DN121243_c0_g1_i1:84-6518(-)